MLKQKERATRTWPRPWTTRLEDWFYAAEDTRARRHGWQIGRAWRGAGREYRDPRWDLIVACELCGGEGGYRCATCQGRGTVWLG